MLGANILKINSCFNLKTYYILFTVLFKLLEKLTCKVNFYFVTFSCRIKLEKHIKHVNISL